MDFLLPLVLLTTLSVAAGAFERETPALGCPQAIAEFLSQKDPGLVAAGVAPNKSEVCGPTCLINIAQILRARRSLPGLEDRTRAMKELISHFEEVGLTPLRGLYFEDVLKFTEREIDPKTTLGLFPAGTQVEAYGTAGSLDHREQGQALTLTEALVMPEGAGPAIVQIQLHGEDEIPGFQPARYSHFMVLVEATEGKFIFLDPQNPSRFRTASVVGEEKVFMAGKALALRFDDDEFAPHLKVLLTAFVRLVRPTF